MNEKVKTIIKPKSLKDVFSEQIADSIKEHDRSNWGVFLSSLSAGLEVGFSVYCIVLVVTSLQGFSDNIVHVFQAAAYTIGFIFVVLSRSELFTEQTALSVLPVLKKKASLKSLAKLWLSVFSGNILGCFIFALIFLQMNTSLEFVDGKLFESIAYKIVHYGPFEILISAIIAGWLMALLSWMMTSCNDTISRIVITFIVTFIIGLGNLHHSILGATEVFLGIMSSDAITIKDYLYFQPLAFLGNALGGIIFVAVLKSSLVKFK